MTFFILEQFDMGRHPTSNERRILAWSLLIFTTSCFFISSDRFVYFLQSLSSDRWYKQAVSEFWRRYWFFIVKGWHATEYAIFVLLLAGALRSRKWAPRTAAGAAVAAAVLFGATDEWHQTFVQGRDGCVRDVLIDSAGALAAGIGLGLAARRQR